MSVCESAVAAYIPSWPTPVPPSRVSLHFIARHPRPVRVSSASIPSMTAHSLRRQLCCLAPTARLLPAYEDWMPHSLHPRTQLTDHNAHPPERGSSRVFHPRPKPQSSVRRRTVSFRRHSRPLSPTPSSLRRIVREGAAHTPPVAKQELSSAPKPSYTICSEPCTLLRLCPSPRTPSRHTALCRGQTPPCVGRAEASVRNRNPLRWLWYARLPFDRPMALHIPQGFKGRLGSRS